MTLKNHATYALLVDIAKLLRKHGSNAFTELASVLSDPEYTDMIASILENVAKNSGSFPRKYASKKEGGQYLRLKIEEFKQTDPSKYQVLFNLLNALLEKSVLPSLREMKAFMQEHGLPTPNVRSRDRAIVQFIKTCFAISGDELERLVADMRLSEQGGDRTLEKWGSVILNDHESKDV